MLCLSKSVEIEQNEQHTRRKVKIWLPEFVMLSALVSDTDPAWACTLVWLTWLHKRCMVQ